MPDRFGTITGIEPGAGPTVEKDWPEILSSGSIADVLKKIGLDDPLGVGHGSISTAPAAAPPALSKLLGEVLEMPKTTTSDGLSLPRHIRLSSIDPQRGTVRYHGANMTGTPMESSADDFMTLHNAGVLNREGVPSEGLSIPDLIARLLKKLPKSE